MKLNEIKDLLRECGVVGAGGAGFPSYAKLSDKADTIILNCAECEPLLKLHRQVLEEHTFEILSALDMLVKSTGAEHGVIAVKEHYHSTISAVESELGEFPALSLSKLPPVYPSGDEIILIKDVTGRTVEPGKLPITQGVVVCNVESVYNVYRATKGKNVTHKYVTVAGEVNDPLTLRVPLGTRISELIYAAGGLRDKNAELICGGPMMGKLISPNDTVTKTTNAIIALPAEHSVILNKKRNPKISLRRAMSVCCQCRSCTELCSRHVLGYPVEPHMVMRVLTNGGKGKLDAIAGAMFCSSCGLCETYSCPQGLSPRALIAELKETAKKNGLPLPTGFTADTSLADTEYKRVSVERLTMRLGLKKYDLDAPISDKKLEVSSVKIPLSQHIGAPALPTVAEGDEVKEGELIAAAKDGALSVNIHASISGRISHVSDKYIRITK